MSRSHYYNSWLILNSTVHLKEQEREILIVDFV